MHNPIAYAYEADYHCVPCTRARFGACERGTPGCLPGHSPFEINAVFFNPCFDDIDDEIEDREGNPIHAVFSWDEYDAPLICGTCLQEAA